MKHIITLVLICHVLISSSQDLDQVIEDGLIISYFLHTDNFDSIENYLKTNNFHYYKPESMTPGKKMYIKDP